MLLLKQLSFWNVVIMTGGLLMGMMTSGVLKIPPSALTVQATGMPDFCLETATVMMMLIPSTSSGDQPTVPSPGPPPTSRPLILTDRFPADIDHLPQVLWRKRSTSDPCCEVPPSPAADFETNVPAGLVTGNFPKTRPLLTVDLMTATPASPPFVWITPDRMGGPQFEPSQVSGGIPTFVDDNRANVTSVPTKLLCSSKQCLTIGAFTDFCLITNIDAPNKPILSEGTSAKNHLFPWKFALYLCCCCMWGTSFFQPGVPSAEPGMGSLLLNTNNQSCSLLLGTERGVAFSLRHVATSWIAERGPLASTIFCHVSIFSSFFGLLTLLLQLFRNGHRIKSWKIQVYHHRPQKQRPHRADFPRQLMNSLRVWLRAVILPIHAILLLQVLPVIFLPTVGVSVMAWIILLLWDTISPANSNMKSPDITRSQVTRLVNSVPAPLRSCSVRQRLPCSHNIGALQVLAGFWFLAHLREPHQVTADFDITGCFLIIPHYIGVLTFSRDKMKTQTTVENANVHLSASVNTIEEATKMIGTLKKMVPSVKYHHHCSGSDTFDAHLQHYSSPNSNHSNNVPGKRGYCQSCCDTLVNFSFGNDDVTDMEADEIDAEAEMETGASAEEVMEVDSNESVSMEIDKLDADIMEVDFNKCDDAGTAKETEDKDDTDMDVDLREDEKMEWDELLPIHGGWDFTRFHYGPDHVFTRQPLHKTASCVGLKTEAMDWDEHVSKACWNWLTVSSVSPISALTSAESPLMAFSARNTPRASVPPPPRPPPLLSLPLRRAGTLPQKPPTNAAIRFESRKSIGLGDERQLGQRSVLRGQALEGCSVLRDHSRMPTLTEPKNRRARSSRKAKLASIKVATQHRPKRKQYYRASHKRRQALRHMALRCGLSTREAVWTRQRDEVPGGIRLTRFRIRQDHKTARLVRAFTELTLKDCDIKSSDGLLASHSLAATGCMRTTQSARECSIMEKLEQELPVKSNVHQPASTGDIPEKKTNEVDKLDRLRGCLALSNLAISPRYHKDINGDATNQERHDAPKGEVRVPSANLQQPQGISSSTEKRPEGEKTDISKFVRLHQCLALVNVSIKDIDCKRSTGAMAIKDVKDVLPENLQMNNVDNNQLPAANISMIQSSSDSSDGGKTKQRVDSKFPKDNPHQTHSEYTSAENPADQDSSFDNVVSVHFCEAPNGILMKEGTSKDANQGIINQINDKGLSEQIIEEQKKDSCIPCQVDVLRTGDKPSEDDIFASHLQHSRKTNSDQELGRCIDDSPKGFTLTKSEALPVRKPTPIDSGWTRREVVLQQTRQAAGYTRRPNTPVASLITAFTQLRCTDLESMSSVTETPEESFSRLEQRGCDKPSRVEPNSKEFRVPNRNVNEGVPDSNVEGSGTLPSSLPLLDDDIKHSAQQAMADEITSQPANEEGLLRGDLLNSHQPSADSGARQLETVSPTDNRDEVRDDIGDEDALINLIQGLRLTEDDMHSRGRIQEERRWELNAQVIESQHKQPVFHNIRNIHVHQPQMRSFNDSIYRRDVLSELIPQMRQMEETNSGAFDVSSQKPTIRHRDLNAFEPNKNFTNSRVSAPRLALKSARQASNSLEQIRDRFRKMAVERARKLRLQARDIERSDGSEENENMCLITEMNAMTIKQEDVKDNSTSSPPTKHGNSRVEKEFHPGSPSSLTNSDKAQKGAKETGGNELNNTVATTTISLTSSKQPREDESEEFHKKNEKEERSVLARLDTEAAAQKNEHRSDNETAVLQTPEETAPSGFATELDSNSKGSQDTLGNISAAEATPEYTTHQQVLMKMETLHVEDRKTTQEETNREGLPQRQLVARFNANSKRATVSRQEKVFRFVRPSKRVNSAVVPQREDGVTESAGVGQGSQSMQSRSTRSMISLRLEEARDWRRVKAKERAREARLRTLNRDIDTDDTSESGDEVQDNRTPLEDGNNTQTHGSHSEEVQEEESFTDPSSDSTETTDSSEDEAVGLAIKGARLVTQLQRLDVKSNSDARAQPQKGRAGIKASAQELLLKYARPAKAALTLRIPRPCRIEDRRSHCRRRRNKSADSDDFLQSSVSSRVNKSRQKRREEALERARLARFRARCIELENDDDDELLRRDSVDISLMQRMIDERADDLERQRTVADRGLRAQVTPDDENTVPMTGKTQLKNKNETSLTKEEETEKKNSLR